MTEKEYKERPLVQAVWEELQPIAWDDCVTAIRQCDGDAQKAIQFILSGKLKEFREQQAQYAKDQNLLWAGW